jgi:PAS domain S-box-containing protein
MGADRRGSSKEPPTRAGSSQSGPPWAELLEALPAAFYLDRPDGTSVWVSPHLESIIGLTEQEWASGYDRWLERVHPDDRERVVAGNRRFLEGDPRESQSDEYRVVLPDGRVRWIHDRALLIADADTAEVLVYGVLVDVTEERTSFEIAERVGRLFRTLVEHSREAVTIVDEKGTVLYQNPTMGRVVDRPPEWFEGKTPLDLMPPEDAAKGRDVLAQLHNRPGAQLPGEFRLRHKDGSWRVVEGVATNLLHDPAVGGIVLNYRDVTVERERERQLRDIEQRRQTLLEDIINAEAEQRSRIAEELHDDTIQVMAAALMELDRVDRHLRTMDIDAARVAITNAHSALTKATDRTRRLTFELRPQLLEAAGLAAAVRDLADALRRDTGADVKVRTRLGRYPVDIETLVYRTIREVLINVRKHARAANVSISLVERQGGLHGTIRDDGRGFRTRRSPSHPSTHIGMDTARERIRAMTGSFDVTSAVGEGTTVEFQLPLPDVTSDPVSKRRGPTRA